MINLAGHRRIGKILIGRRAKMCITARDILRNRIKYFCETDNTYMCNTCKKDHKGPKHSIKPFKADMKVLKNEVLVMVNEYHDRLSQLQKLKDTLDGKMNESSSKLSIEMDKVNEHYNKIIQNLMKKKKFIVDELQNSITFRNQKIQKSYSTVVQQILKLKESWEVLNGFTGQLSKHSLADFGNIKNHNQNDLYQAGLVIDS